MAFSLPEAFLGRWVGLPLFSMLGPFTTPYSFSISQIPSGDYLLENEIIVDGEDMGWQRFYVAANSDNDTDLGIDPGDLHYCGWLNEFTSYAEQTGGSPPRYNRFNLEEVTENSVTFCYDSDDVGAFQMQVDRFTHLDMNPFQYGCERCSCANWTITLDNETDTLTSSLQMGAGEGHSNSRHLFVELSRTGNPPVHDSSHVYGSGCDFSGKDGRPVTIGGCPFLSQRREEQQREKESKDVVAHCYVINEATDYRLAWTLDENAGLLNVTISAPAESAYTWVALGFRPKGRSIDELYTDKLTGRHSNFGMLGADIVAGSESGGVRTLFAELYTGPPVPSSDLEISSDSSAKYEDGRITVSFSRPLLSGYLANQLKDSTATLLDNPDADIIWAIGSDESGGSCSYHDNNRGYRFINWRDPQSHLATSMVCDSEE